MPVSSWSTTASNNATADSASDINWAEGMAPSQVNDSARALMAVIKGDFANILATNGYQKLPNGLIIQWGIAVSPVGDNIVVTFPMAFPSACLGAVASIFINLVGTSLASAYIGTTPSKTGTSIQFRQAQNGGNVSVCPANAFWVALGF